MSIGLKNAKIVGRFQVFETKPTVILDVAHNPQSIDILKDNLKKYFPNKKFHAVFGVLKDKDVDEILIKLKRDQLLFVLQVNLPRIFLNI